MTYLLSFTSILLLQKHSQRSWKLSLRQIWNTQQVLAQGHSKLIALWKGTAKGSSKDPATYRRLQVGSSLCKIMVIIISNRLKDYLKGRNFRGKKISRISRILAKFAKTNSLFDPRKCRFAKIIPAKYFKVGDS